MQCGKVEVPIDVRWKAAHMFENLFVPFVFKAAGTETKMRSDSKGMLSIVNVHISIPFSVESRSRLLGEEASHEVRDDLVHR